MEYDLRLDNAIIVDGEGAPHFKGSIGIRDGRIAALGHAGGDARRTIDVDGKVACPGFVDLHTHYDAQILWDRMLSISPWHGVTTVVMGNCGFGVAPTRPDGRERIIRTLEKVEGMSVDALHAGLGDDWAFESFPSYLDAIRQHGVGINVAALLGHTPLRLYVMGEDAVERAATADEVSQMCGLAEAAMKAGAVGFATSKSATHVGYAGKPVPSRVAGLDEISALATTAGRHGGVLQATVGRDLFLDEFRAIHETSGCPITWTALLAGLALGGGDHLSQLEQSERLAQEGLPIYPQVTPRPLNFEYQMREPFVFEAMSLFKPVSAADLDGKQRIYRDAAFRAAFREKMRTVRESFRNAFRKTVISFCIAEPDLNEALLVKAAEKRGTDPVDLLLDLSLADNLSTRFRMPVANHNEDEVEPLLKGASTVIGLSDAGAHASQLCDACLPTYFLQRWVREKGVFTLEEAVRMLTSRPADVMGLKARGRLRVGLPADIVVFDPDTVGAGPLQRINDLPAGADRLVSESKGISHLVVNGTLVREHDRQLLDEEGTLPGQVLRTGGRAA